MKNLSGPVKTNFPRIDGGTLQGVLVSSVAHTWPAWPTETADKLHLANFRPVPTTPCVSRRHSRHYSPGADYPGSVNPLAVFFGDGTVFDFCRPQDRGDTSCRPRSRSGGTCSSVIRLDYARLLPTSYFLKTPTESLDFVGDYGVLQQHIRLVRSNGNYKSGKFYKSPGGCNITRNFG